MNRGDILKQASKVLERATADVGDISSLDTDDQLSAAALGLLYVTADSLNSIAVSLVKIAAKR